MQVIEENLLIKTDKNVGWIHKEKLRIQFFNSKNLNNRTKILIILGPNGTQFTQVIISPTELQMQPIILSQTQCGYFIFGII